MDPSANPYSSDANMFVGAPIQSTGEVQAAPVETVVAPTTDEGSLFSGMQQTDPFAQPGNINTTTEDDPFKEKQGGDFFGFTPQENQPPAVVQPPVEEETPSGNHFDGFYTGPGTSISDPVPVPTQELENENEAGKDSQGQGQGPDEPEIQNQPTYEKTGKCWKIAFYQEYFDVDTSDVVDRLKTSLMIMLPPQYMEGRPADLYGPVWVSTTLWMMLAIFNFLAEQWHEVDTHTVPAPTVEGDTIIPTPSPASETTFQTFTWIVISVGVCYGYIIAAPVLVWLYLKWNEVASSPLTLISLYGYSMLPFILCLPLTMFSFKPVKWGAIFVSSLYSLVGISYRLHKLASEMSQQSRIAMHVGVAVIHSGITILLFYEILILG